MNYRKLLTLSVLSLLTLASCSSGGGDGTGSDAVISSGESASSATDLPNENTAASVTSYFEQMKNTKNGSIRYSTTASDGTFVDAVDIYTPNYIVNEADRSGQILLPSYDANETQSPNVVYNFTYDEGNTVSLANAAVTSTTEGSAFKSSFASSDNVISYLGNRVTKNSIRYDEGTGEVYSTSLTLIRSLATAVNYPNASAIQSGARVYFEFSRDVENELYFYVVGTYSNALTGESADVELPASYIFDVGVSRFESANPLDESLLADKLTSEQLSSVVSKPAEFITPLSADGQNQIKITHGTDKKLRVTQTFDGRSENLYLKENPDDRNQVHQYMHTSKDTIDNQRVIEGTFSDTPYLPEDVFNPNAFVRSSDGLYHYIGAIPAIDNIFVSYFFFPASELGGIAAALALSVDGTTDKVSRISTVIAETDALGSSLTGSYSTIQTDVSTNPQDFTMPAPFGSTDAAVTDGLAKGFEKLKMNNDVLVTSTTSNVTGTTENITATYYIDKTNKVLYKEQKSGTKVLFSKGWKETKTNNVAGYTPFKIQSDNSLKAINHNKENASLADTFINGTSTNIFKLKEGTTDTYVLKGFDLIDISSSFLFGPNGLDMIPSTLEFHTLADGTIDRVSYDFSTTTTGANGQTVAVNGTETLTFTYDADIKTKPFTADFSTLGGFVAPTTWAEQDEAIQKNIDSFFNTYVNKPELASTLPYLFDTNVTEYWQSTIVPPSGTSGSGALGLVAPIGSTEVSRAFVQSYAQTLSTKGYTSPLPASEDTYIFLDPTQSFMLIAAVSQQSVLILIQPYSPLTA